MNRVFLRRRTLEYLLLSLSAVFFFLRFLHLSADFPNGSRWMDWSKYTDEGWYGDAAIRHFLLGHWHVAGDFNAAAALPVWPLIEGAVFHFTGVGLIPARILVLCIFGVILLLTWVLVRRFASPLSAALAVLLNATSSFSYAFSRLAILEPPLTMLFLLAMLVASLATPRRWWTWILVGALAPAMVLTKTTGACLLPAVAVVFCWRMWPRRNGSKLSSFLLACSVAGITAASIWGAYFFEAVKPHYYADYHYLFTDANPTPKFSVRNLIAMTREALHAAFWIDRVLYPVALAVLLLSALWLKKLWRNALYNAMWIAIACYMAFVIVHSNMQPRYFHLMLVPMVIVIALGFDEIMRLAHSSTQFPRQAENLGAPSLRSKGGIIALKTAFVAVLTVAVTINVVETIHFVTHPEYTFVDAARSVARLIAADRSHPHLLLSISGSDITLITGVPSICDDFGTQDLETKALHYKPGWYAAWNELDEGTMSDITPHFRLREVAKFKAFDDPDRNLLILYRMTPRTKRASRRAPAESAD
jgi:4-amino-4-deoxy-L-arabinose transferase-like glycosyltransferase